MHLSSTEAFQEAKTIDTYFFKVEFYINYWYYNFFENLILIKLTLSDLDYETLIFKYSMLSAIFSIPFSYIINAKELSSFEWNKLHLD